MAINKDAALASGILLVCVVVLAVAFSDPGTPDTGNDVSLAGGAITTPDEPSVPGDQPDMPSDEGMLIDDDDNQTTIPLDQPELPSDETPLEPIDDPGIQISRVDDDVTGEIDAGDNPFRTIVDDDPIANDDPLARIREAAQADDQPSQPTQPSRPDPVEPTRPGQTAGGSTYVVAKGDSLGTISMKVYGTSRHWKRIQDANDIDDPTALQVGQVLQMPAIAGAAPVTTTREQPVRQLSSDQQRYTVRKGDSYYIIAQRELGDSARWKEIQDLNQIDAYDLLPGQVIVLPAGRRPVAPPRADSDGRALPSGAREHVVGKGEVLGTISQRYYGTARRWREIAKANGIVDPESLLAGQKLIIPRLADQPFVSAGASAPAPASRPAATGGSAGTYTVRSGDTLADIAQRVYGDANAYRRILEANPGLNPRRLRVGQVLTVPGASGGSSAPAPSRPASPAGGGTDATRLRDLIRQAENG